MMIKRSLSVLSSVVFIGGALRAGAADAGMAVPPMLRFTSPSSAEVIWESERPGKGALAFGKTSKLGSVVQAELDADGMVFRAKLRGLEPGQVYHYKVATTIDGKRQLSPAYEFSNVLNFSIPEMPPAVAVESPERSQARQILEKTGVTKGYCLTLGLGEAALLEALARQSELIIYAVETDSERAAALREALYAGGAYGARVSVLPVASFDEVPLTPCFANLVLTNSAPGSAEGARALELATPGRGKVVHRPLDGEAASVVTRPALEGIGEWTHQYGDAANTANSGETLSGASSTEDLTIQWVGRPGGDFGIDRNPRMPAPVAASGRLFHQGMNRVAALDAYNGSVLWSLEIPDLRRVNIPRDSSNWCVSDDQLFMAVRDRAWIHDAATGERLATLPVPSGKKEGLSWGYIAHDGERLFGSGVQPDAVYERFWGGGAWYDAKEADGLGPAKVCSDRVFAYDLATRQLAWTYEKGVILNPTIGVGDGKVIFIESRNEIIVNGEKRQIQAKELWNDQYLVALEAETGKVLFEKPVDMEDGTLSFYLQITGHGIVVTASNKEFHVYNFDLETGELNWHNHKPWPDDHHSGHIQHPVVVNETIYLQPNGYDLKTGEIVTTNVGERSGCHTYVGASDCLIYRGENRQIAIWDQEEESVTSWTRLRPSCWLSVVPSNGMLLVPEGGAGCSCGGWMETSLVFAPRKVLGQTAAKTKEVVK